MTKQCSPRCTMSESESGVRCASQNTHPSSGLVRVTYGSLQGDQRRSIGMLTGFGSHDDFRRIPREKCRDADPLQDGWPSLVIGKATGGKRLLFGFRFAVDQFFELFAGLEVRHLLRRHVHLVARLRVPALAGFPLAQPKAAEAPQLDLLTAMQRINDALEDRLDDDLGVFLGEVG